MVAQYHIYGNGGSGGAIDYGTPLATVTALTWDTPALALGSDWWFAVRAFDPATGLEESNTDARVRIAVSATGTDLGSLPQPVLGLKAWALANGAARVRWSYAPRPAVAPTEFRVWLTAGSTVDFTAAPQATVPYTASDQRPFGIDLSGLSSGVTYTIGVRSANSAGADNSSTQTTILGRSPAVPSLVARATISIGS